MATLATARPIYQPAMRIISSITNDYPALVTTSFANQYGTGMIVRLNIPQGYGMQEANQLYGPIVITGDTTFTIDIDTRLMSPFVYQISAGTTDGSGNASGTLSGTAAIIGLGQLFYIGTQMFEVVALTGALYTTGIGTGTMNLSSGAFTFTGALANTDIVWVPIAYPFNRQYSEVTPIGEVNSLVRYATRNIRPSLT